MTAPDGSESELLTRVENGVLWLTINRPERGNAVAWYVRDRLIDAFQDAHRDLSVRSIVLTSAGERHFCTGADLTVPNPMPARPEGAPERVAGAGADMMRRGFPRLIQAIQACEKPIIVALNGTAAGGGAALVLAADLVIAADTARIIQVFIRRGLVPDSAVTYLLPQQVGMHKAKELLFFGDDLSAVDAETLGIVNKVVAPAELESTTRAWAERLATGPTKAIGWAKKLLQDGTRMTLPQLVEQEAFLVEVNTGTMDSTEGVAAYRERRDPQWQGW